MLKNKIFFKNELMLNFKTSDSDHELGTNLIVDKP